MLCREVGELHAAPGNPGIGALATVHDVGVGEHERLTELAMHLRADLVVIGPEAPLVGGLADRLELAGIACFGPSAAAAQIEGSKAFAKQVMEAAGVPTARFSICDTPAAAQLAIAELDGKVVVKADGLAAGKGVFVCSSAAEAEQAVRICLIERRFGESGSRVLIEERISGPEVSMLALCDGERVLPLAPARDHKRLLDGDEGPNTGGMGRYRRCPNLCGTGAADHRDGAPARGARAGTPRRTVPRLPLRRPDADGRGTEGARVQCAVRRPRGAGDPAAAHG